MGKLTPFIIQRLACHQIHALIKKGESVEELKVEWKRRWALDYPLVRTAKGIEQCSDYR